MRPIIKEYKEVAQLIYDRISGPHDCFVCADGEKGAGKSTFFINVAKEVARLAGTSFTINDNMTWKRSELQDWILPGKMQKPERSVIIADEMISVGINREFMNKEQIKLIKIFNMCRNRHLAIFGAIPNFWMLDWALRDAFIFRVYFEENQKAYLLKKSPHPQRRDSWCPDFDANIPIRHLPTYRCDVRWPKLSAEVEKEYLEIRNKKYVVSQEAEDDVPANVSKAREQRNRLINGLLERGVSQRDIAKIAGLAHNSVHYILERSKVPNISPNIYDGKHTSKGEKGETA